MCETNTRAGTHILAFVFVSHMACDRPEGPFDLPSVCRPFPHVCQRRHPGITDMAQRPSVFPLLPAWDQAHRSRGIGSLIRSQGHGRIPNLIPLGTHRHDLVGDSLPRPRYSRAPRPSLVLTGSKQAPWATTPRAPLVADKD